MLDARGGLGGNVALQSSDVIPVMGSGIGGNGGGGGTVGLVFSSPTATPASLVGGGSVSLAGGMAGAAGSDGNQTVMLFCDGTCPAPIRAGSNGLFGTLTTSGSGRIGVPDAQTLSVDGPWSNQLAVSLTGTGTLFTSGQLTNTAAGTIELAGTASTPVVTSALVNAGQIRKTLAGTQTMALSEHRERIDPGRRTGTAEFQHQQWRA